MLITGSIATLNTPFREFVINNIFAFATDVKSSSQDVPITFYILFFSGLFLAHVSYKIANKTKESLVFDKKILGEFNTNNSALYCYLGSVTEISDIDVIVTSENSELNLASTKSPSVSGRVRKLASEMDAFGNMVDDPLFDFVQDWKKSHGKLNDFNLGLCIFSPPFNSAKVGIQSIINAVSIQKNEQNEYTLSEEAINSVIKQVLNHCRQNSYASVFIPVFGLGSGNIKPDDAVELCVSSICKNLKQFTYSIKVYIGVYRVTDSSRVLKSISKNY